MHALIVHHAFVTILLMYLSCSCIRNRTDNVFEVENFASYGIPYTLYGKLCITFFGCHSVIIRN